MAGISLHQNILNSKLLNNVFDGSRISSTFDSNTSNAMSPTARLKRLHNTSFDVYMTNRDYFKFQCKYSGARL